MRTVVKGELDANYQKIETLKSAFRSFASSVDVEAGTNHEDMDRKTTVIKLSIPKHDCFTIDVEDDGNFKNIQIIANGACESRGLVSALKFAFKAIKAIEMQNIWESRF